MTSKERISIAAKMMDAEVPGWFNLIDIDNFDITSCSNCVLGQVFGPEMESKLRGILGDAAPSKEIIRGSTGVGWRVGYDWMLDHGYSRGGKYAAIFGKAFSSDNCLWKEEIISRQVEAAEGPSPDIHPLTPTENHD